MLLQRIARDPTLGAMTHAKHRPEQGPNVATTWLSRACQHASPIDDAGEVA
jgi:hypothetical protein